LTRWATWDAASRPLVIGESFGGLLAVDVATRLKETDPKVFAQLRGFVLINPATSYDRTAWSGLG
jgi:pimeloyl-ACP methyl ester carboxylesterase